MGANESCWPGLPCQDVFVIVAGLVLIFGFVLLVHFIDRIVRYAFVHSEGVSLFKEVKLGPLLWAIIFTFFYLLRILLFPVIIVLGIFGFYQTAKGVRNWVKHDHR